LRFFWGIEEKEMTITCHDYVSLSLNELNSIAKILDTDNLVVCSVVYPSDSYVDITVKDIGVEITE